MLDRQAGDAPVLFSEAVARKRRIGVARLNAPASLNALTLAMIRLLDPQLRAWAADPDIACVVLWAEGERAFCAGGDVRGLYAAALAQPGQADNPYFVDFFGEEYRLDHLIHTYAKPILAWANGIVMGGGVGIMAGASHRVVTETTRLAMPEVSIGIVPDVGADWFMRRFPGRAGLFHGLTGTALDAADAMLCGMADHVLANADREAVLADLAQTAWSGDAEQDGEALSELLVSRAQHPAPTLAGRLGEIDRLTAGDDLDTVLTRIAAYTGDDPFYSRAAASVSGASPTAMAVMWAMRQRTAGAVLADVLRAEMVAALRCCAAPDFAEGVRARLIDKDKTPRWQQAPASVEDFFAPPWGSAPHPLADL